MAHGHTPHVHPLAGGFAGVNTQPPRSAGKPVSKPQGAPKSKRMQGKRPTPVGKGGK